MSSTRSFSPSAATAHTLLPKTPADTALRADMRSPSPNYFGFPVDTNNTTVHSAGSDSTSQWTSVDPKVRSAAAASPQTLTLNTNTNGFEAFRRQSDHNPFFNLSSSSLSVPKASALGKQQPTAASPSPSSPHERTSSPSIPPSSRASNRALTSMSQVTSRSPKRMLSSDPRDSLEEPRRQAPLFNNTFANKSSDAHLGRHDDHKQPRLSLPHHIPDTRLHSSDETSGSTSEMHAAADATFQTVMESTQHAFDVISSNRGRVLLLDLRVSTQYARSRIAGSLNLCVPTTLLKRPAYTVKKLAYTFKDSPEHQKKFESWRLCDYIIVYDATASQLKEATSCVNVLKKFSSEGWTGNSCIIRGGFAEFERKFPELVDHSTAGAGSLGSISATDKTKDLAPVIGGCPMPLSKDAVNPFFGNIRQNMDLIGGVGQMPIHWPVALKSRATKSLPAWLSLAADESDNGKRVSEKFLHIEEREQKRMQDALSGEVSYGKANNDDDNRVKIAGLEKGSKNRYNNIFPYEHSRVRLKGIPFNGCDYVNASFVQTSRSAKRYIATQGPIPSTFEDFWKMVWQRDVRVIVMLTAESEGGQIKAHNYWDNHSYGPMKVRFLSEHRATLEPGKIHKRRTKLVRPQRSSTSSFDAEIQLSDVASSDSAESSSTSTTSSTSASYRDEPYIIVRKFSVRHTGEPFERIREVTQLQYAHWPDFGTPAHPTHLLGLVEHCNAVIRTSSLDDESAIQSAQRPVLVHCSAGCGRTGTFCTVDTVIDLLRRQSWRQKLECPILDKSEPARRSSMTPDMPDVGGVRIDEDDDSWLMDNDQDLIEQTVEEFRLQRLSMVQSLRQFVLCYESVLEWIAEGEVVQPA